MIQDRKLCTPVFCWCRIVLALCVHSLTLQCAAPAPNGVARVALAELHTSTLGLPFQQADFALLVHLLRHVGLYCRNGSGALCQEGFQCHVSLAYAAYYFNHIINNKEMHPPCLSSKKTQVLARNNAKFSEKVCFPAYFLIFCTNCLSIFTSETTSLCRKKFLEWHC